MKRSFSALFVLITALSGPLVITPPAVSRPNNSIPPTQTISSEDEPESSGKLAPRSEQEHNQPNCLFPLDNGEAPEDLVVLPEDFDYELFSDQDLCEIEQSAASQGLQNDTTPTSELPQIDTAALENYPAGDFLCLPFAEELGEWEPWEGPAVAGVEPPQPMGEPMTPQPSECELESIRFDSWIARTRELESLHCGRWAINLYENKSYELASEFQNRLELAIAGLVEGATEIESWAGSSLSLLISEAQLIAESSVTDISKLTKSLSQTISSIQLTSNESPRPTPPFCECLARQAASDAEEPSLDPLASLPEESNIDDWQASESTNSSNEGLGNELEFAKTTQNEAIELQIAAEAVAENTPDSQPLADLQETVEEIWGFAQEQTRKLEQLAREYDLKLPTTASESQQNPAE